MLKLLLDSIEDYKTQLKDFEDKQKALEDKVQSLMLTEELDAYKNVCTHVKASHFACVNNCAKVLS